MTELKGYDLRHLEIAYDLLEYYGNILQSVVSSKIAITKIDFMDPQLKKRKPKALIGIHTSKESVNEILFFEGQIRKYLNRKLIVARDEKIKLLLAVRSDEFHLRISPAKFGNVGFVSAWLQNELKYSATEVGLFLSYLVDMKLFKLPQKKTEWAKVGVEYDRDPRNIQRSFVNYWKSPKQNVSKSLLKTARLMAEIARDSWELKTKKNQLYRNVVAAITEDISD